MQPLFSERNRPDYASRYVMPVQFAGSPFRHSAQYPDCFFVKRRLNSADDGYMTDCAVCVDDKRTCHSALNASFICSFRIFTCIIYEFHKLRITPGEGWLLGNVVIFIYFHITYAAGIGRTYIDPACLSACFCWSKKNTKTKRKKHKVEYFCHCCFYNFVRPPDFS